MSNLRFAASITTTVILILLLWVLAMPAFDLPLTDGNGGLAAGTLPQFVVVAIAVLAFISLLEDIRVRARRHADVNASTFDAAPPTGSLASSREVLTKGGGVLVLLGGYVFLWEHANFPVASAVFMALATLLIAPRSEWTPSGLSRIFAMSVLFSVSVWLVFVYVLQVPLR